VQVTDPTTVLDWDQLRDITLNDEELMREILSALIDDTSQQITLLEAAIREADSQKCMRLANYSKGTCANVGANAAAALLKEMEQQAGKCQFPECGASLAALSQQIDLLREQVGSL
jgi:HPt (histidine-containing phosphotransfer) domain-containing protein